MPMYRYAKSDTLDIKAVLVRLRKTGARIVTIYDSDLYVDVLTDETDRETRGEP